MFRTKKPHWVGRNNSWKCQEGSYQKGLTDRLNSSQYYQYSECAGAAAHTPHRLQSSLMEFAGKGEMSLVTVNFILFLLSPAERALLTPSTLRQVKCAVLGSSCPFSLYFTPRHQTLEARSGVPQSGSHKQVVPSAHCGCPPSTSTTLPHSLHLGNDKKRKLFIKKGKIFPKHTVCKCVSKLKLIQVDMAILSGCCSK